MPVFSIPGGNPGFSRPRGVRCKNRFFEKPGKLVSDFKKMHFFKLGIYQVNFWRRSRCFRGIVVRAAA